jgi:NAD(P)-dependent dehydrogenase (short-subunit alcohol dehydrogenase family)
MSMVARAPAASLSDAPAALVLCSPLAAYITGAVLPVDGGFLVA